MLVHVASLRRSLGSIVTGLLLLLPSVQARSADAPASETARTLEFSSYSCAAPSAAAKTGLQQA